MKPKLWRPPPFRRRAESTRKKYRRLGLCLECGAGLLVTKKVARLTCHHPNCPVLKKIIAIEKRGICSQCGTRKEKREGTDRGFHVVREWCPNGHGSSMTWK